MHLLRWDDPVPAELQSEAGVDVWTRYIVRTEGGALQCERVAAVWHGPSHPWSTIRGSFAWAPFIRGLGIRGTVTIVSGRLSGGETVDELRALALAAGGPVV